MTAAICAEFTRTPNHRDDEMKASNRNGGGRSNRSKKLILPRSSFTERGVGTKHMNFNDLRKTYTSEELSYFPGDNDLRFRAFSPLIDDLFESKVVYYEKFICLVRLEDIQITPEFLGATAVPYLRIERTGSFRPRSPVEPWTFKGSWSRMCLVNNSLNVPYAGWTIWPEAERVKAVESLIRNHDYEEALRLTLNEPDEE
jgi:hypothetical protein